VAVGYQVNAEVIDISTDQPRTSDALLVDSNVWLWMTYLGPGASTDWRSRVYPNYIKRTRRAKAKLLRCGLSLCELAHQIEQAEFEVFQEAHPNERAKEFRHNYPLERRSVATSLRAAWRIIKSMAVPLDLTVDDRATDAATAAFESRLLDGYDLLFVHAMSAAGINQVLTDDGDYCTVPGLQLFTANRQVIEASRVQGKLLTR
jgi:hypothetical protein